MSAESSFNPFHQFEIIPVLKLDLFGIDLSFSNSSLVSMIFFSAIAGLFFVGNLKTKGFLPNKIMSIFELTYKMINGMVEQAIGKHVNIFYQKIIFSFFLFIISANIFGLMPMSFTVTSHIIITFAMALIVFFICIGISIKQHGFGFFHIFIPKGTPAFMLPLIFVLEVFSYLARPVSLSVRLAANMMAGHIMLDVIAYFIILMGFFGIFPFIFLVILQMFEIAIAILQAYIFSMLACVYIGEAKIH